jgi:hypothetical protein
MAYSIYIIKRGLSRQGLNKEVRQTIIKRQYQYVLLVFLTSGLFTLYTIYLGKQYDTKEKTI